MQVLYNKVCCMLVFCANSVKYWQLRLTALVNKMASYATEHRVLFEKCFVIWKCRENMNNQRFHFNVLGSCQVTV